MSASSVTGIGQGAADNDGLNRVRNAAAPRIVASGVLETAQFGEISQYTILFPKEFKQGTEHYVVSAIQEPVLPSDEGSPDGGEDIIFSITKLDDRHRLQHQRPTSLQRECSGNMKGFVVHTSANIGGEGDVNAKIMWMVATVGYDSTEFLA